MTKNEALKLALDWAYSNGETVFAGGGMKAVDGMNAWTKAIREALAQPEQEPKCGAIIEVFGKDWRLEYMSLPVGKHKLYTQQYTYIAPTHQKPFGWKLVPIEPTNEMLKAMDECSTEGYDERLLAGHASSVYMAAVDVAPTPPQQKQEPVAWMMPDGKTVDKWALQFYGGQVGKPLYTTPPAQRTWVGLMDEHPLMVFAKECVLGAYQESELADAAKRAIEAAHGIKE